MNTDILATARRTMAHAAMLLRDLARLAGPEAAEEVTLESGARLVPGLGLASCAADLRARGESLAAGTFNLPVIGMFNAGKSTLLNAMLGEHRLVTRAIPATAVLTILEWGEADSVLVHRSDRDLPDRLTTEDFLREYSLNPQDQMMIRAMHGEDVRLDRFAHVRYAVMTFRHPLVENGVRLIDSPGLEEANSRTQLTHGFLPRADAIVLVVNAGAFPGAAERRFLQGLPPRAGESLFVVVNKANQLDTDEDRAEVGEVVENVLRPLYADEEGTPDPALYARRVFWVDALAAKKARFAEEGDASALARSGILAFERELGAFLASPARIGASLSWSVALADDAVAAATAEAGRISQMLAQPLEGIEERHRVAREALERLRARKEWVGTLIARHGEAMTQKTVTAYRERIDAMHGTFLQDLRAHTQLEDSLGLWDLTRAVVSEGAKQELADNLDRELKRYFEATLEPWAKGVPEMLSGDAQALEADVRKEMGDFIAEIGAVQASFAQSHARTGDAFDLDRNRGVKITQLILGFGDPSQMVGSLVGSGDWTSFFGRMVQQILTLVVVFTFLTGGVGTLVLFVIEGILISNQHGRAKEKILATLRQKIHEGLVARFPEDRRTIERELGAQFERMRASAAAFIDEEVDHAEEALEHIVEERTRADFSLERATGRMEGVLREMRSIAGELRSLAEGGRLTEVPRAALQGAPSV